MTAAWGSPLILPVVRRGNAGRLPSAARHNIRHETPRTLLRLAWTDASAVNAEECTVGAGNIRRWSGVASVGGGSRSSVARPVLGSSRTPNDRKACSPAAEKRLARVVSDPGRSPQPPPIQASRCLSFANGAKDGPSTMLKANIAVVKYRVPKGQYFPEFRTRYHNPAGC